MTKKDYELIAKTIREVATEDDHEERDASAFKNDLVTDFAYELGRRSPRFDTERFVRACGGEATPAWDEDQHAADLDRVFGESA
jgi:hypothetical protein